jgi:hypothetical protein
VWVLEVSAPRTIRRLLRWFNQIACWHRNDMRQFTDGRIALICPDCGRQTTGWEINHSGDGKDAA